ncbi:hypothetical protein FPV67DRAFT_1647758 [Lyophyllum atratum]|nr:hypothetical protein FPV67DRAFT_1647758 [Lyophyllum atratum]
MPSRRHQTRPPEAPLKASPGKTQKSGLKSAKFEVPNPLNRTGFYALNGMEIIRKLNVAPIGWSFKGFMASTCENVHEGYESQIREIADKGSVAQGLKSAKSFMSIDLEWTKLDSSLSTYLVDVLNRQLANAERPSFIGPVEVTSLDFGSTSPDVELVDLRDIYRDFLEDDDDDDLDRGPVKVTEGAEDEDSFEWVSRRAVVREEGLAYHHLPPHVRYGLYGSASMFSAPPSLGNPMDPWNPGMSLPSLMDHRSPYSPWPVGRSPSPATPFYATHDAEPEYPNVSPRLPHLSSHSHSQSAPTEPLPTQEPPPPPQPQHPNLQVHLHVNWHSDLRITLTTSLLINYPSPMFMSLPIKLSITGLVFTGELAVAYEGERRRVHICILDNLDPYGPACDRSKRDSVSSTPPELDDDAPPTGGGGGGVPPSASPRSSKPLPVGQRLLPSIYIESEIGQADKHVLKNVTRVERFIQDVIRKTVEEELVFPNFHTLVMGEPSCVSTGRGLDPARRVGAVFEPLLNMDKTQVSMNMFDFREPPRGLLGGGGSTHLPSSWLLAFPNAYTQPRPPLVIHHHQSSNRPEPHPCHRSISPPAPVGTPLAMEDMVRWPSGLRRQTKVGLYSDHVPSGLFGGGGSNPPLIMHV